MEITPETMAMKIFNGKITRIDGKFSQWFNPISDKEEYLPTFQESEWTGLLLEKALETGYHYCMCNGENGPFFELYKKGHQGSFWSDNKSLNFAIAEAILEAEGK